MTAITGVHPYADQYPMLPEGELAELAESIATNGLRTPVVLTPDGLILDGRNRVAACALAGVIPDTEVYEGEDLAEYVIDCNSARRHMSMGARAMSNALVLVLDGKRNGSRWEYGSLSDSTDLSDSMRSRLRQCGMILDHCPGLAQSVVMGELALDAALREAMGVRDEYRERLAEEDRIGAEEDEARAAIPPSYQEKIGTQYQSARVALAAWEDDNRAEAALRRREKELKERKEREQLDNHRQACRHEVESLTYLAAYVYPEARERFITEHWRLGADGASPALRPVHSPARIREVIAGLAAYADELETHDG